MIVLMVPLMLVLFIANLDQTIVVTAVPSIGRDLHDPAFAPWIVTGYMLTGAITTLVFGTIGDLYGRKKIFQFSIVVFLIGSLLSGTARSVAALSLFRALQGIGGGGLNSLVMAITAELVPPRQRAKYLGLLGAVATLALVAGPLLGGAFSDGLSWRWIFYVNLPIGVVALVAVHTRLHLAHRVYSGRLDVLGAVTVTVFTTSVMLFTTWGGHEYAWTSGVVLGLIALGLLSLAAYLRVERRAAAPLTPPSLFRSPVFDLAAAQFLVSTLVLVVAMLFVPMFLQSVQGKSAFTAGLYEIPLLLGVVAATAVSGPLITRTGRYKAYPVAGSVLTGAAMWSVSRADGSTGPAALAVALTVAGVGIGCCVQVALLAGQNAVEQRHLGAATGTLNFFKSLGGAFGAALFGAILTAGLGAGQPTPAERVDAFRTVFFWTVPFMALALVLALAMKEKPLPVTTGQEASPGRPR
ncbi:MDR family MFS transporter [Streptomyces sp. NPDC053048]|uniref:MDR family MFS transporter n=1 Tax=Streptomyces sp. NPDC053048 TaxID=3365694 RepID=UPI0037D85313